MNNSVIKNAIPIDTMTDAITRIPFFVSSARYATRGFDQLGSD
jgi:hypothetical protein